MTFSAVGVTFSKHVGLEPLQAPDQEKPDGSDPADDVAVKVTAVEFVL